MSNSKKEILNNILLFHQYFTKKIVIEKLSFIRKFKEFDQIYTEIRKKNKNDDVATIVAKSLKYGLENNFLSHDDLDELLFIILEDSLFNAFLYKFDTSNLDYSNPTSIKRLYTKWKIPSVKKVLSNVNSTNAKNEFTICGYREQIGNGKLESLRLLLLDRETIDITSKGDDVKKAVYPTIIEFDFLRNLLHIRLKDVDNILNTDSKISTMSGRISNTLKFIDKFDPNIIYSNFRHYRSSLFKLEEHLLSDKRKQALKKLKEFDNEIKEFTKKVMDKFNPPQDGDIPVKEYISNGVLSVIATTLDESEAGDIVGIRFRNNKENINDHKYAEITINDKGFNCISTNNLYWLNLPVLLNRKMIEFLKISKSFESGFAVANLEFSQDTANIRLLQKSKHKSDSEHKKPTQEKYDELISFLLTFLK